MQLANTDDMRVEADISENDIAKVAMGMPAVVVLDAYPDLSFDAAVVKIYPEAGPPEGHGQGRSEGYSQARHYGCGEARDERQGDVHGPVIKPGPAADNPRAEERDRQKRQANLCLGRARRRFRQASADSDRAREFEHGVPKIRGGLDGGEMVIVAPPAGLTDGQRLALSRTSRGSAGRDSALSPFS